MENHSFWSEIVCRFSRFGTHTLPKTWEVPSPRVTKNYLCHPIIAGIIFAGIIFAIFSTIRKIKFPPKTRNNFHPQKVIPRVQGAVDHEAILSHSLTRF